MMAKSIKTLELHYPMIQFLIIIIIPLSLPMSPRAPQPNPNPLLPPKRNGCEPGVYPNAVHLR